jgi:hypothetical protein
LIGRCAFSDCTGLSKIKLPESINQIDALAFDGCISLKISSIPEGVTSISFGSFRNCSSLEKVALPDTITSMEGEAFSGCRNLVTNIPPHLITISYCAFYDCESLKEIILPDSVTDVQVNAFYNCKSATVLKINGTISSLEKNAFNYCSSIKTVTIPDKINELPYFIDCDAIKEIIISKDNRYYTSVDGVIYNKNKTIILRYPPAKEATSYVIPNTVTTIREYAFSGLSVIKNVTIPDTVTNIGRGLFYGSSTIESVTFPTGTTKIPPNTFYGTNIKNLIVSDEIEEIGYQAFAYCKKLKSITIPATVTSLGEYDTDDIDAPFVGCDSLEGFIVSEENKTYTDIDGILYKKADDEKLSLICYPSARPDTSFKIPENTISMYSYAFYKCDNLKKLYLPKSLKGVYSYFRNCINLKIMVPASVTEFMSEEHITDWPIFNDCTNCYLYVKANSQAYKYCEKNKVPYKIWN